MPFAADAVSVQPSSTSLNTDRRVGCAKSELCRDSFSANSSLPHCGCLKVGVDGNPVLQSGISSGTS